MLQNRDLSAMAGCCDETAPKAVLGACPVSGTVGRRVERRTVKALLRETALRRVGGARYRFCADPACAVVYFDEAGTVYVRDDLRVPVWEKEPFGARMICYCFGENEADIRSELERVGASHAVERVREHVAAGRCACETRNPRGVCCLGDLAAAVEGVRQTLGRARP